MCELMGYSFAEPIVADFSIREFAHRGEENAEGWGLAWYPDKSLALVKEAAKWEASKYTDFLESYAGIRSSICIAHVRRQTVGKMTRADSHPFAREWQGREYCFAHNGTLKHAFELPLQRFHPIGSTDSEHFFCHLLDEVAGWENGLAEEKNWPRLNKKLAEWNAGGTLNCLLSDGRRLVSYHDAGGWKGLHFRRVIMHSKETRRFEDPDLRIDLGKGPVNFGLVIATSPLSSSGWESFQKSEMLLLQDGVLRYSSHGRNLAVFELNRAS